MALIFRYLLILFGCLLIFLLLYGLLAYVLVPQWWRHYEAHVGFKELGKVTQTAQGIPGDPLNVGLIGSPSEIHLAMAEAGWRPADPKNLHDILKIAESVATEHPYPTAPVSNLYLEGRKQDLAFERPAAATLKKRHHVRLWHTKSEDAGRPIWVGATSFDVGFRFSRYDGQILHRIAPDIDAERNRLISDLVDAGQVQSLYQVTGLGPTLHGRNGEGDWYYTDGEMKVGVLSKGNVKIPTPPVLEALPFGVELNGKLFTAIRYVLKPWNQNEDTSSK